ncbi:MAG: arylesterase [Clostridia bacterium]|nr:arylesterase [Clostridia bacterium]
MKKILAFGDSNTWGFNPSTEERYASNIRWTKLLQTSLEPHYLVLEEGLCGRTTCFDEPGRPGINGLSALPGILQANAPIDKAILMLGTNDCKKIYNLPAAAITEGLKRCLLQITEYVRPKKILLISPVFLEEEALGSVYDRNSLSVCRELKDSCKELAAACGTSFLAASSLAKASTIDGEHLTEEGHEALFEAILSLLLSMDSNLSQGTLKS